MEEKNDVRTGGSPGAGPAWEHNESGVDELLNQFGFSTFILSLSTSVLVHLGELPDPISNKKEVNLQLAKQTISIIEMLQEKTKGNLTNEESELLSNVLYDVRLKYVEASK
jgi:hypothetical protein